jgi:hypothetical protein
MFCPTVFRPFLAPTMAAAPSPEPQAKAPEIQETQISAEAQERRS